MTRAAGIRTSLLFVMVLLMLAGGCARLPEIRITPLKPNTTVDLTEYLLNHKPDLEQFRLRGPFDVTLKKDHEVRLSAADRINTDLYLSSSPVKAALVVILHGHDSSKEAHALQAMHLASWGMHTVVLQLPGAGPWDSNGSALARIVNSIYRSPEVIDRRIDANTIILVGHSFGGYAVTVAMAEGAPVAGGILLDPALVGEKYPTFLQKISKPVMLLGADEDLSPVRYRDYFFHFIRSGVAEVSIKDASHDDAQFPSEFSLHNFGIDPHATEELQITFVSALTSAAFSLSATRTFDYAWNSFRDALENGKFYNGKRK